MQNYHVLIPIFLYEHVSLQKIPCHHFSSCNRDIDQPQYLRHTMRAYLFLSSYGHDHLTSPVSMVTDSGYGYGYRDTWPSSNELGFNPAQFEAFKAALTQEFVVIQGMNMQSFVCTECFSRLRFKALDSCFPALDPSWTKRGSIWKPSMFVEPDKSPLVIDKINCMLLCASGITHQLCQCCSIFIPWVILLCLRPQKTQKTQHHRPQTQSTKNPDRKPQ